MRLHFSDISLPPENLLGTVGTLGTPSKSIGYHHGNSGDKVGTLGDASPPVPSASPLSGGRKTQCNQRVPSVPTVPSEKCRGEKNPPAIPPTPSVMAPLGEATEERAAILEFDAGLPREAAERVAKGEAFRCWFLHFRDQEPHLIHCTPPATYREVLEAWPGAIAAVPDTEKSFRLHCNQP